MPDDSFWQLLLAGELSARKANLIAQELAHHPDRNRRLREHAALTETERRRIASCRTEIPPGAKVLTEMDFSSYLAEAEGPPAIFVSGDAAALHEPCIAIVGTRSASLYGKACAQKFAEGFARAGVTVVSGGALGIDAAAHKGALAVGGRTAAVLAGGVDNVYPSVHAGLFGQIRESGCLVSQFACGAKPGEHKFLLRNDLIASLCIGVLVVEAPNKSGALRTAATAAELGREVFVVPATIDNRAYWGSLNLIRDGATLVYHPDQVLESLDIEPVRAQTASPAPEGDTERLLAALSIDPISPEGLVERTGLDPSTVLSELTLLELDGRIVKDASGYALKP
ncbi:DNA-protecting protein DprA [bacterium]|nr:MAG: DNA-protecting protein DprA [bacterium]